MRRDFSVLSFYEKPPPRSSSVSGGWGDYRRRHAECDEHRSERGDGIELIRLFAKLFCFTKYYYIGIITTSITVSARKDNYKNENQGVEVGPA
jgi:hypothetical protein